MGLIELGILFLIVPTIIVFAFLFLIFRLLSGSSGRSGMPGGDETRIIQELHQGFSNLEKRIEALETILLDRYGKDRG